MRKQQQRQILDLLESISQAQAAGLYGDCQEAALSLCDFIEAIEGSDSTGTETVALLVEYCELLFKRSNAEIGDKFLRKHFTKIKNNVNHKLKPNRLEIAFISYKASMSDSLESIYLAAKADPNCDAFWIPVPYYSRNSDGSNAQMHYEGADCYDDKFIITDWQFYDIEARRPDAIFTFAPYDGNNFVTSVHQDFYCERLRNFTDMLIYVPYSVFGGIPQEMHFTTSACMFAHKVVLQSEKIRDAFIEGFKKNYGDRFGNLKDKFVAWGSPKFDAIVNAKREDFILPEPWQKLIDGKNVVLYNTSISAILEGNEQYLKKLRDVLEIFKNRNDVVLWWRPHPLNKSTYESMRPRLYREYETIINDYSKGNWGIYDDTVNLQRAILCTDFYYGDKSSLIPLYQATGNPVVMTTPQTTPLLFESVYDDGVHLWFSPLTINGLFKMDKRTRNVDYVGDFQEEESFGRLHSSIVQHEDNLYLTPFDANTINIYNLERGTFKKVDLQSLDYLPNTKFQKGAKFSFSVVYKDFIYFFPYCYPAIVRYSCHTGELDYFVDWIIDINTHDKLNGTRFFTDGVVDGSVVTLFCFYANAFVTFDMDTCCFIILKTFETNERIICSCFDGESHWLATMGTQPILKWDMKINKIIKIPIDLPGFKPENVSFNYCIYANGYAWFFPGYSNKSIKINIKSHHVLEAEEFKLKNLSENNSAKQQKFVSVKTNLNNKLCAIDLTSSEFIEYDVSTTTLRREAISFPTKNSYTKKVSMFCKDIMMQHCKIANSSGGYILNELSFMETSALIDMLLYSDEINSNNIFSKQVDTIYQENANVGNAGNAIYDECKKWTNIGV